MPVSAQQIEELLWNAIEIVRRERGGAYASPLGVIGLLFYKFLSDRSATIQSDVAQTTKHRWILPTECRWSNLDPTDESVANAFHYLRLHSETANLANWLVTVDVDQLLHIGDLRGSFGSIDLSEITPDALGLAVEHFLEHIAQTTKGSLALSAFYTPSSVTRLMAELLNIQSVASVYDPACGFGSLLLSVYRLHLERGGLPTDIGLFGQESNYEVAFAAQATMVLNDIPLAEIQSQSSLMLPKFYRDDGLEHFNYAISSPPLGVVLGWADAYSLENDPYGRFPYGIPTRSADLAYVQDILARLSDTGRAVMLVLPSMLMRAGGDGHIRQQLIDSDFIEAVISLPSNLLYGINIPVAILVLNKHKPVALRGKMMLVDADEEYETGRQRYIGDIQRQKIVQAVLRGEEHRDFSRIVNLDQVQENNYILTPARYFVELPRISFLGRQAEWRRLSDLANISLGTRLNRSEQSEGRIPVIRGRDLSITGLQVENLATLSVPTGLVRPVYSKLNDILIQRIGQTPRALRVDEGLLDVLVGDTVFVIRPHAQYAELSSFIVEFLNSDAGQSWLSARTRGAVIPSLTATALRDLPVPIPDKNARELIEGLRNVENDLTGYLARAREIRQGLFSIEDPEQATADLLQLSARARMLSTTFTQVDDLEFQIRNFFPYPLAFTCRMLSSLNDDATLYKEQLRLAENILAFIANIELALAVHTKVASHQVDNQLTQGVIIGYWQRGISPGHWVSIGRDAAGLLRDSHESAAIDSIVSLWYKGSTNRPSKFSALVDKLVELKNDFKHDRGPQTPEQYRQAVSDFDLLLRDCLGYISFLTQYPVHRIERAKKDWVTGKASLNITEYTGDHPALKKIQAVHGEILIEEHLYLKTAEEVWVSLYPFVTVQYCPTCQTREVFMLERNDGQRRVSLKSFERGHTIENNTLALEIAAHFMQHIRSNFPA